MENPDYNKNCKLAIKVDQTNKHIIPQDTQYEVSNSPICARTQKTQSNQINTNRTDTNPRYLTLYIQYPTKPHKQPSDSNIIMELLKHKQVRETGTSDPNYYSLQYHPDLTLPQGKREGEDLIAITTSLGHRPPQSNT
ncbi:hypothetical protein CHS0354_006729 [Potamilus streckersoni]|uniref:Uncharacterized protein n=1 Tax=Potamilus streckersoni TaxID=2493646 RepID=A0AAE0RR82_9BIVA|nr:hypothetical protein CHS0354_006729 [Potamilus streckersoni]